MALKLTYQASEFLFDIKNLPSQLLSELERFIERNKIVGNNYCERCFRAHVIMKARELRIGKDLIIQIKENMSEEIGHNGYYLDGDKLIRF